MVSRRSRPPGSAPASLPLLIAPSLPRTPRLSGHQRAQQEATTQLLQHNAAEYRRYTAERAVRCLRESEEEKPDPDELRALLRTAGELKRWRRRRRPPLMQKALPPRDPELPDLLQAPAPPHSRWLLDSKANVLFNAFNDPKENPVENFYLQAADDEWRTHRYGVYGLRYPEYPNPATILPPNDSSGLYYRSNKKMLADPESARLARKSGEVVTLQHVKAVAVKTVGQIFPKVYGDPDYFNVWPHMDEALGAALEYFYHYFEQRRVEETVVQLQCRMYDTDLIDARLRRLAELEAELGTIYAKYLLGFGLPFHHLCQGGRGAGYRSTTASDRHIFEAFLAFVTQVVWITYRRPNITAILREMGRLFRTPGFDPAKRTPPPNLDPMPNAASESISGKSGGAAGSLSDMSRTKSNIRASKRSLGTDKQSTTGGTQQRAIRDKSTNSLRAGDPKNDSLQSLGTDKQRGVPTKTSIKAAVSPSSMTAVSDPEPTTEPTDPTVADASSHVLHSPAAAPSDPTPADVDCDSAEGSTSARWEPPRGQPQIHVSMKKVYGLYKGPPPPGGEVYKLLRINTPLLRGALSTRRGAPAGGLLPHCDRGQLGILGTPRHHYDDVLSAIDYEREQKEARLKFMGPKSAKEGKSRVVGVIPYLTLPSKFFSPDA